MRLNRHAINNHAPKCGIVMCINRVGYHSYTYNRDGTFNVQWKRCCEYHRTIGKSARVTPNIAFNTPTKAINVTNNHFENLFTI